MEKKHTPGPWLAIAGSDGFSYDVCAKDNKRGMIYLVNRIIPRGPDNGQANARLIASAPDLLASLIECLPGIEELNGEYQDGWDDIIKRTKAAIKKATTNMQTEMTTSDRLRVVAEFDKPGHYLLNNFSDQLLKGCFRYDRDWNETHRVWIKWTQLEHNKSGWRNHHTEIMTAILNNATPELAFIALSDAISWYNSLTK